uniref:Uncharacterized protein n=1 Tax=Chrysotila carterae TaxID=13221 RepID=A0A7S4BUK7_CHRCT|eukprot:1674021-Pleurochrysis_carterae.AAC.1
MEGTGERGGSRVQSTSASYWLLRCLVKEISVSQPKAPKKIMPQSAFLCGHAPSPRSHLVPATPACCKYSDKMSLSEAQASYSLLISEQVFKICRTCAINKACGTPPARVSLSTPPFKHASPSLSAPLSDALFPLHRWSSSAANISDLKNGRASSPTRIDAARAAKAFKVKERRLSRRCKVASLLQPSRRSTD